MAGKLGNDGVGQGIMRVRNELDVLIIGDEEWPGATDGIRL
jgi:hypothetical protein